MRRSLSVLALLAALAAPAVVHARADYARANRLAVNLGFGFGSASMGRLHDAVDSVIIGGAAGPKSGLQINAEISFRYYFPFHLLAQVGYGAIYNRASETYGNIQLTNHNLAMEVPILIGGYYSLIGRIYLYGAIGPSIFFYPRAFLEEGPDFKASGGVGLQALIGADFMAGEHFAVGLELRFRYLKTGDLSLKDDASNTPITEHMLLRNGSSATYNLDFTGITLGLNLRFFAL